MLFLLRTDQELGISREADAAGEVKAEPVAKEELPEAPADLSLPPKKNGRGKGKGDHSTNRIFIRSINKASEDYMYLGDKMIVKNAEKILYIDSNSETEDSPEVKKALRRTLRQYLHTNLESVCNSIEYGKINVNAPLNTSTFNRNYEDLKMDSEGMTYKEITKSAQRNKESAASAGAGDESMPSSVTPEPQPGMMDSGIYYSSGQQYFDEPAVKKSKRGRKEGKFKRFL